MKRWWMLGVVLGSLALAQYTDLRPSDPEWLAVQALTEMGVIYGYPDGAFRGERAISRREVALALYRLWTKAKEQNNQALQELAARLAQDIGGLAKSQSALDERLTAVEKALAGEDAEALRAEIASLKSSTASTEEALSRLITQYADLASRTQEMEAKVAAVDQRSLAWNEDSVQLQKGLDGLREEVARLQATLTQASQRLESAQGSLEGKLQGDLQRREEALRGALEAARQEISGTVSELSGRLKELEGRLTETREELFKLSDEVRSTKESLTARLNAIEKAPNPLYVGVSAAGLSPLVLSGFVGHDTLLGLGLRVGVDWRQDTGDFRLQGAFTLPIYREPARGVVGFGLAYALSGPASGESSLLLLVGGGVRVLAELEVYGEGRAFYPLDGSTPFARIGLGLRVRP